MSNLVRPARLFPITIRLDPHSANKSLFSQIVQSKVFPCENISVELGRALNHNKNPVAEKAIKELVAEMLKLKPDGGKVSPTQLSQAVASLNSRIRSPGLSAQEVFTQRDQSTGEQLDIDDQKLIYEQLLRREKNHRYSEISKSKAPAHPDAAVSPGSLVYVYDKSKLSARPRYLVLSVDQKGWCKIKRFAGSRIGPSTYTVKQSEIYCVPDYYDDKELPTYNTDDEYQYTVQDVQEADAAGEVISEPGDNTPEEPCSSCQSPVSNDDKALTCDTCSHWCHITCGHVTEEVYEHLIEEGTDVRWMCPSCISSASDPRTEPTPAVLPPQ